MKVRPPAVAGRFYPADADRLASEVRRFLACANAPGADEGPIKALIVPHAGYVYSGPVAASGYARLHTQAAVIERVILLGTCHSPGVHSLAATSAEAFSTPLGTIAVDRPAVARALRFSQVQIQEDAHDRDHAIEVQLPFLQVVLGGFSIVPFLVGRAGAGDVAEVLESLWDGETTLIIVSSDLSHHLPYDEARRLDEATARAIERLDGHALGPRSACGRAAIAGLLQSAREHGLRCRTVDLRSSADTAGPRDEVVGYGAWVLCNAPA